MNATVRLPAAEGSLALALDKMRTAIERGSRFAGNGPEYRDAVFRNLARMHAEIAAAAGQVSWVQTPPAADGHYWRLLPHAGAEAAVVLVRDGYIDRTAAAVQRQPAGTLWAGPLFAPVQTRSIQP